VPHAIPTASDGGIGRAFLWVGFKCRPSQITESTYKARPSLAAGFFSNGFCYKILLPRHAAWVQCWPRALVLQNGGANAELRNTIMASTVPREWCDLNGRGEKAVAADWGTPWRSPAKAPWNIAGWLKRQTYCRTA